MVFWSKKQTPSTQLQLEKIDAHHTDLSQAIAALSALQMYVSRRGRVAMDAWVKANRTVKHQLVTSELRLRGMASAV